MHAEKLLERLRRSPKGRGQKDLHRLYIGYGFECEEGSKHRAYIHPKYPHLHATVGRHDKLAVGFIKDAIELVEELIRLEGTASNDAR